MKSLSIQNPGFLRSKVTASWDFDDNFTSYADQAAFDAEYPTSATGEMRGNPTTDVIDWKQTGSIGANHQRIYNDLIVATISDTAWVLRQPIEVITLTAATSPYYQGIYLGISSVTAGVGTAQDFIGHSYKFNSVTTAMYAAHSDGTVLDNPVTSGQVFATALDVGIDYNEIIRTSATQFTDEIFSNSAYSTSVEKETKTISSGVQSLRYWVIQGYDNATGGLIAGKILANLRFANGVTVAP